MLLTAWSNSSGELCLTGKNERGQSKENEAGHFDTFIEKKYIGMKF